MGSARCECDSLANVWDPCLISGEADNWEREVSQAEPGKDGL